MSGVDLIALERARQREQEFFGAERDDAYQRFELTAAAISYARQATCLGLKPVMELPLPWPLSWDKSWWKPSATGPHGTITLADSKRMLVKAGALIAAELDRLSRLEAATATPLLPSEKGPGDEEP